MFNSFWIRKPNFKNIKKIDYNEYWRTRGFAIREHLKPREEIMLKLIPSGVEVIDVGCGNSGLALKLKEKGVKISVADFSSLVIGEYQSRGIVGTVIDLKNTDSLKNLPQADFIILSEVLEHLDNPEEVIQELKVHADKMLITVPNSASYQFRLGLMFNGRFFTQWANHPSEHLRYWSHIDFLDWLEAMGLMVEKTIPADGFSFRGLFPALPKIWKNLLGFRMVYLCKVAK